MSRRVILSQTRRQRKMHDDGVQGNGIKFYATDVILPHAYDASAISCQLSAVSYGQRRTAKAMAGISVVGF